MENIHQTIIKHLTEKWGNANCPMCKSGPWEIQGVIFGLTAFTPGYITSGVPTMPLVPVVCRNCGNTVLINAKSCDLFDEKFLREYSPPTKPVLPEGAEG